MKINNFRGDLTDNSAEKEALYLLDSYQVVGVANVHVDAMLLYKDIYHHHHAPECEQ